MFRLTDNYSCSGLNKYLSFPVLFLGDWPAMHRHLDVWNDYLKNCDSLYKFRW